MCGQERSSKFPKPNTETLEKKKSRVHSNISEVLEDYIRMRVPLSNVEDIDPDDRLQLFTGTLKRFTSYSSWRELSSLNYGDPSTCSIVSSMEFDKDGEVFAVAGVTKKIKVCHLL